MYFYNVETDAFFLNGMDWNANACATRLTNGDKVVSIPQQCYALTSNGTVSVQLKSFPDRYLSCLSGNANDIWVDQNQNRNFTYTETTQGSRIYTLRNTSFGKDLDVTWDYGGHITIANGAGHTKWAFISETDITSGAYALYKAKKQLHGVYKAVCDAGKQVQYSTALATAHAAYTAGDATESSIINAARTLFNVVSADIEGPLNVSFLFNNPDMIGAAGTGDWSGNNYGIAWGEFEVYHAPLTLSQTQIIPQGIYDVVLHALYRQDGSDVAPVLNVSASNNVTAEVPRLEAINYQVNNDANDNTWVMGATYFQPNGMQSCAQALAHTDAVARAENVVLGVEGEMTISAQMTSGSQWFNWQGFEIIYWGVGNSAIKGELSQNIELAERLYDDGSWSGANNLRTAIDNAINAFNDATATISELTQVNETLLSQMEIRQAMASTSQPFDWSLLIENPSFENGFNGWTQSGLALQGNTAFTLKDGNTYVEKWTGAGNAVGDASAMQTIKKLGLGVFILKVSAQNIQEGSSVAQSNTWLIANESQTGVNKTQEYSLTFTNIEYDATIGFKAIGATGNWLACDNFKLYYAGGGTSDFNTTLQAYIKSAKDCSEKKMNTSIQNTLSSSIAAAENELQNNAINNYPKVSTPLRLAKEDALASIAAYESLQNAIDKAVTEYGNGSKNGADKFLAAINQAKAVNNDLNATIEEMKAEEENLENASFQYLLDNASGTAPVVITDTRFVKGSDLALGRLSYSGVSESQLLEVGFCWATHPEPTILDNRSTSYFDWNGRIYQMQGLQPATVYYARAYALTKNYAVGYGDVIKIITLPRGECSYWYNWGADGESNERINNALADAIGYYNRFTSIKGFHVTCNFGSETPTADCSYGGWMRVGPNASYQRTGTILHEMAHGIGVGTHWMWSGYTPLRENGWTGLWMGERANKVLQFFDNNNSSMMTGDATHMWPYGINGAHEDSGNPTDYMINAMIVQGMGEDGLPPTGGFATPAYTFASDEGVKYYIKNESEEFGLTTAYLTETANGTLKWVEKSNREVENDDAFAWYVDFLSATCYYRIRNAKSGKYFTYSSNTIKTESKGGPGDTENFQLMGGRVRTNVGGSYSAQGFWIIVPHANMNPPCLEAQADGNITTVGLSYLDNAQQAQRWIFIAKDEIETFEGALLEEYKENLTDLLAEYKKLPLVPHIQKTSTTDSDFNAALGSIESRLHLVQSSTEIATLIEEATEATKTFLSNAIPSNSATPFDLTFLLKNPSIEDNSGWSEKPTVNFSCAEFYERTFNMYQTLVDMPAGTYRMTAQAFQRPGDITGSYNNYVGGNSNISTKLYINADMQPVKHIASEAEDAKLHDDDATAGEPAIYFPNTMASAAAYFANGKYNNEISSTLTDEGDLTIGIMCDHSEGAYWSIFDNFKLFYYGSPELQLDETATAAPIINNTFDKVTLKRTIKPNTWSTFVVPFDIPASSLNGWEVKELVRSELKGNIISLVFNNATDGIKSGVPYMVRNTELSSTLTEITMNDVSVNTTFNNKETDHVTFTGVYHNGFVPEGAYFISGNKFYLAADNSNTMKGYRAYIMPKPAVANVNMVEFRWEDETAIQHANSEVTIQAIYNISGVRLNEMQRGINILQMSDGTTRKVIVK